MDPARIGSADGEHEYPGRTGAPGTSIDGASFRALYRYLVAQDARRKPGPGAGGETDL